MSENKKQKPTLTVTPTVRKGLVKIGERHGAMVDDKFKPQTPAGFKPKKKVVAKKNPKKKVVDNKKAYADKQRTLEKRKAQLRMNATEHEIYFWYQLKKLSIPHLFQKGVIDGDNFCIPDFYIKSLNMVVELDGEYHDSSKQQYRDYYKDKHYAERGFRILRMRNEKVYDFDFNELKKSSDQRTPTEYLSMFLK